MEYSSWRRICFAGAGTLPPTSGNRLEWLDLFLHAHSRSTAQGVLEKETRIGSIPLSYAFLLALGIGVVAGLRSLTAPAVVAWSAHLNWLNLHGSPLAFVGSTTVVAIFC